MHGEGLRLVLVRSLHLVTLERDGVKSTAFTLCLSSLEIFDSDMVAGCTGYIVIWFSS
jgi:hypothetical protein